MLSPGKFSDDPLNHMHTKNEREHENVFQPPHFPSEPEKNCGFDVMASNDIHHITAIERLIKIRSGFSNSLLHEMINEQGAEISTDPKNSREVRGGRALLYPELPWGAPPGWEQGHSRGQTFLIIWDCIIFLCCLYVAGAVPFELGILDSIQRSDSFYLSELSEFPS